MSGIILCGNGQVIKISKKEKIYAFIILKRRHWRNKRQHEHFILKFLIATGLNKDMISIKSYTSQPENIPCNKIPLKFKLNSRLNPIIVPINY